MALVKNLTAPLNKSSDRNHVSSRFFLFTGKGGVGKTVCALSFAKYLTQQHQNTFLITLSPNRFKRLNTSSSEHTYVAKLCNNLKIKHLHLDLKECITSYVAHKLNSTILAKWIVDTKFFTSLIEILPSFSDLIYLGKILHELDQHPDHYYVLDAPATGHALAFIESIYTYHKIFSIGPLHKDTLHLKNIFTTAHLVKMCLVYQPQDFAITEVQELAKQIWLIDPHLTIQHILNTDLSIAPPEEEFLSHSPYWKKIVKEQTKQKPIHDQTISFPLIPSLITEEVIHTLSQQPQWQKML